MSRRRRQVDPADELAWLILHAQGLARRRARVAAEVEGLERLVVDLMLDGVALDRWVDDGGRND